MEIWGKRERSSTTYRQKWETEKKPFFRNRRNEWAATKLYVDPRNCPPPATYPPSRRNAAYFLSEVRTRAHATYFMGDVLHARVHGVSPGAPISRCKRENSPMPRNPTPQVRSASHMKEVGARGKARNSTGWNGDRGAQILLFWSVYVDAPAPYLPPRSSLNRQSTFTPIP